MDRRVRLAGIGLLLMLAFGLRLHHLSGPSLWNDEGLSLYRARASWGEALRGSIVLRGIRPIETIDNHPPLYFALLKAWITLAGDSEFALRFPSVYASILLIPFAWITWRRLAETTAAQIAVILLSISPLYLWYGQEARMYTLLALEGAVLLFFLLRTCEDGRLRAPAGIAIAGTMLAMLLTHYTAILLFLSLMLWALLQPQRNLRRMAFLALLVLATSLPLLPFFYQRLLSGPERDYRFVPLSGILIDVLRASGFGAFFPYDQPLLLPAQWAWVGAMAIGAWRLIRHRPSAGLLLSISFAGPLVFLYGLSHLKPLYQNIRHLFLLTPILYILASAGLATLIRRHLPFGILVSALVFAGMLLSDWFYFSRPYPLKDDWRDALRWVSERATTGDLVILQDLTLTPLADYYYRGSAPLLLTSRENGEQKDLVQILKTYPQPLERIWLIVGLSQEDLSRPDQALFNWLSARGLYLTQQVFPSRNIWIRVLVYELYDWDRPPSPQAIPVDLQIPPFLHLRWLDGPEHIGSTARWWFFWKRGTASSLNLWLRIQLVDETGTIWAGESQPIWPSYPPDRWPTDQLVRYQVRLSLPPGLPPGIYRLRVEAFDLDQRIPINGAPAWESPPFPLEGHTRPAARPAPRARSHAGLSLLDIQPEVDPPYFPGLGLPIRLLWEAEATPPAARTMALFWQQGATRRLLFRSDLGPPFFPSARWQAGQIIAQRIILPLPHDLRGYGQIRLVLYDAAGRELPWETLWPFHRTSRPVLTLALSPWPVRRKPIPLAVEGRACFEDQICLDRYEIAPGQAAPGETVEVRLAWHVLRRPERPGVVFVHLARLPDQPPLATGDAPPQGGRRPILTWEPGEYAEDVHKLEIPSDLPAGRYRIFVGWYSEEGRWRATDPSGTRYPMDAVPLGEIEVRP
ncbi:glycosyltransferase family 39 protein [Thermoflexus sp.]|uniref:glycosyltransferase family 39 protein n=1 Tax=Thermoflexus sp. TaxID=1969742 RepID=UPI0035E3F921